jgi:acetamidase/formamidase
MTLHLLEPTLATLHGHFSRELPPVLTIAPGDRVRFKTLDVRWGRLEHDDPFVAAEPFPGRDLERDPGHAICGPVWIEGACAGMALEVRVISLRVGGWGWTSAGGHPSPWNTKLGLDGPPSVPVRWALDPETGIGRDGKGRTVELRPFLGVMGMPPDAPGRHPTSPPRACGGNIDCKELVQGSTLYLPIPVDGALFSAGDGHAVQGDGEVAGPALECPMQAAELEFHLRPELKLARPRAHTPRGWITFGFHDSLDEATALALSDMLDLLDERLGCGRREALALASLVVDLHVTQIVNGVRGVHAMVADEALARLRTS